MSYSFILYRESALLKSKFQFYDAAAPKKKKINEFVNDAQFSSHKVQEK